MTRFVFALLALFAGLPAPAEEAAPHSFFLVARPNLPDRNFEGTVVLMARHGAGGPLGVIVNRPTAVALSSVFPDIARLAKSDQKLFFGGPVARDMLSFVFRAPTSPDDEAIEVMSGVYMSIDKDLLHELLDSDRAEGVRVFAGLAAWAPGQLESEVSRGDWHMLPADAKSIFDRKPEGLWPELNRRASATMIRWDAAPAAPRPPGTSF